MIGSDTPGVGPGMFPAPSSCADLVATLAGLGYMDRRKEEGGDRIEDVYRGDLKKIDTFEK